MAVKTLLLFELSMSPALLCYFPDLPTTISDISFFAVPLCLVCVKAAYLAEFRVPWAISKRNAEGMDRCEYLVYIKNKRALPLRLAYKPRAVGVEGYVGAAFIVDLGLSPARQGSVELLSHFDDSRFRISPRCMYEHCNVADPDGHMAVGHMLVAIEMLQSLCLGLDDVSGVEMLAVFERFVTTDGQLRFFMEVNSGDYRDIVEEYLQGSIDRSPAALLAVLESEYELTRSSTKLAGTFHGRHSLQTAMGLITDSKTQHELGLHAAIVGVPDEDGNMHHSFTMWTISVNQAQGEAD